MAHVQWDAGEQVGGADGGEVDPQRADRDAVIGPLGGVHGQQIGVTAERFAAERATPGLVAAPGGAVDSAGAVAAGARGVDNRPGGQGVEFSATADCRFRVASAFSGLVLHRTTSPTRRTPPALACQPPTGHPAGMIFWTRASRAAVLTTANPLGVRRRSCCTRLDRLFTRQDGAGSVEVSS